jgi:AcrR family transcriptional regulator
MVVVTAEGAWERRRVRTRAAIQAAGLELIARQGFESTTCEQIAAAAGISPATFFRYFPTKEDVVLQDDYDPLIADVVRARPARERPVTAFRRAMAVAIADEPREEDRLRARLVTSVPALRSRSHEQLLSLRGHLAAAFADRMGVGAEDLSVQVVAAACAAAVGVAVERWAAGEGDLGPLVDLALRLLDEDA